MSVKNQGQLPWRRLRACAALRCAGCSPGGCVWKCGFMLPTAQCGWSLGTLAARPVPG